MATYHLLNTCNLGTAKFFPGDVIDEATHPKSAIETAGGVLWPSADATVAAAAALCRLRRQAKGSNEAELESLMISAAAKTLKTEADTIADPIQSGTGTLSSGVLTVDSGVTISASSRIVAMRNTNAGTVGAFLGAPDADRVVGGPGTGEFVIRSFTEAGAAATSDTSTVDWIVSG